MAGADAPHALIVDDHPLFRDALQTALEKASGGRATTTHCGTLEAALTALNGDRPNLVLLDLNLSDASGFDGILRLTASDGDVPIAICSATESPDAFARARALGARAYLPKSLALDTLAEALSTVLAGGEWFPETADGEVEPSDPAARVSTLTPAQRRVLDGLSEGLLNKQIAYEMGISEATVKAHMTAIFRKLGVNNRTQALLALKSAASLDDYSAA